MSPLFAICIGASTGALCRWQLGLWLNPASDSTGLLPWGTLAANLIGGYLVGLALGVFHHLPNLDPAWRLVLVTGFLGGLTSFSSFSGEVITQIMQGRLGIAALTAGLHLLGTLALTWLGLQTISLVLAPVRF